MMTDARSIGGDGKGRIYVGEYSGGRVEVFDASGTFLHQWTADPKMPLRGFTVDRKGVVYIAQRGVITRYQGETGQALGPEKYNEDGFDDLTVPADGGMS